MVIFNIVIIDRVPRLKIAEHSWQLMSSAYLNAPPNISITGSPTPQGPDDMQAHRRREEIGRMVGPKEPNSPWCFFPTDCNSFGLPEDLTEVKIKIIAEQMFFTFIDRNDAVTVGARVEKI